MVSPVVTSAPGPVSAARIISVSRSARTRFPEMKSSLLPWLAAVVAVAVAVPDVTIPLEPIYNTGGNQCYDQNRNPQVLTLTTVVLHITRCLIVI